MDAVDDGDDAIEPVHAVKSIRHRKDDDRQQEEEIEEDFAAAAFRREGEKIRMRAEEQRIFVALLSGPLFALRDGLTVALSLLP